MGSIPSGPNAPRSFRQALCAPRLRLLTFLGSRQRCFVYSALKSQVNEPPSRFPNRSPMERDAFFQSLPLYILQGPQ